MKIAIIGNAGSGKSNIALTLHKLLHLPLYHLDQYFWKPGWVEPDPAAFEKIHHELCDTNEWIIEGIATRLFGHRIEKADIVIFLDIPTYRCLYRIFKRMFTHFGTVYFSSAQGCPERGPSLKFLTFVWNFNRERKPIIQDLLHKYKDRKTIFVVKNNAELHKLIETFKLT